MSPNRRFWIRTYGCQMNVHDSQKLANLLHHAGLLQATSEDDADVLVINTCSIRDKAEHQLYSDLGVLRSWKSAGSDRVLGVGGCVAQQVGDTLLRRFSQLDFAFGTHNLRWVPSMIEAARSGSRSSRTEESTSLERFDLPALHPELVGSRGARSFLTVMEGCDMFCSFCIVPQTRGREISRPAQAIVAEARTLAEQGVRELVLLGQTVNAYGRHDRSRSPDTDTVGFAELLTSLDAIVGIDRLRYTSPHPIFYDTSLCQAHADLASLCPHVHLPAQSGSDRILAAMRRRYDRDRYLRVVEDLRRARPDIAITSDLIVGFPGETEADFEATLALLREAELVDSYSFKYSPRPGTAAIALADPVPPEECQRRLLELQRVQRNLTLDYHRSRCGSLTQVLIDGPSRKSSQAGDASQLCGRDPYHRVVNIGLDASSAPAAGSLLQVVLVDATPHSLIAELPEPADSQPQAPKKGGLAVKGSLPSADETGERGRLGHGRSVRAEAHR